MGGLVGWWLRFLLILRLSQPSLAGVGTGAELGNRKQQVATSNNQVVSSK